MINLLNSFRRNELRLVRFASRSLTTSHRCIHMAEMALLRAHLENANLSNPEEVKGLFESFIHRMETLDNTIEHLKYENSQLRKDNVIIQNRVLCSERYLSRSCLTFLGVKSGVDPMVPVLDIMNRVLGAKVSPEDLAACHYLPGNAEKKPIIVKFIYNGQRDYVWRNRFTLTDNESTKNIFIVERLPEIDRDTVNYAKEKGLKFKTNNCQPLLRINNKWVPVNSRGEIDKVASGFSEELDGNKMDTGIQGNTQIIDESSYSRNELFQMKHGTAKNKYAMYGKPRGEKRQRENVDMEDKLDKLCGLIENVIAVVSSPPGKMAKAPVNVIEQEDAGEIEPTDT